MKTRISAILIAAIMLVTSAGALSPPIPNSAPCCEHCVEIALGTFECRRPPPTIKRRFDPENCHACGVEKAYRVTIYRPTPHNGIDRIAAKRDTQGELLAPCEWSHRLYHFSESLPEPCPCTEQDCERCDDCTKFICVCECEPIGFEIVLDLQGGELPSGTPSAVRTDAAGRLTGVLPVPTREGHLFFAWRVTRNGNFIGVSIDGTGLARMGTVFVEEDVPGDWNVTTDFTLYAMWEEVADTTSFNVTLDANGGSFYEGAPTVIPTAWNQRIANQTIPTPTRVGYHFEGWRTEREGGSVVNTASHGTRFESNVTIYARWRAITVRFNPDTGTFLTGSEEPQSLTADGKLTTLPTVERSGFDFVGWYTHPVAGELVTTDMVFQSYDVDRAGISVWARWRSNTPGSFTITLNAWSSTVSSSRPLGPYEVRVTTPITVATDPLNGRVIDGLPVLDVSWPMFVGWNFEQNQWFVGNAVTNTTVFTEDTTIHAEWRLPMPELA